MTSNGPKLPSADERRRLGSFEISKRTVEAFDWALGELVRKGRRPFLADAAELIGGGARSLSSLHSARQHLLAVEVYNISPQLSRDEAIRRMRLMEPAPQTIAAELAKVKESRGDSEILADAISNLIQTMTGELTRIDPQVIAGFLTRDPGQRGATKSALVDLNRWLAKLDSGL